MKISIIVAIAGEKRVIGKKGGLPWHLPEELKRFKQITMGHPIIMGRKTHKSIGKVLPGRTNIIITHDSTYLVDGGIVVGSLEEALRQVHTERSRSAQGGEEVFIIGGGQIYQEAINLADKLYLTYIDKEVEGDTFFPDYSQFKKTSESDWQEYEGLRYKFLVLERIGNFVVKSPQQHIYQFKFS